MDSRLEKDMRKRLRVAISQLVAREHRGRVPRCILVSSLSSGELWGARLHFTCLAHDAAWSYEVRLDGSERYEAHLGPTMGSPCPTFREVDPPAHKARVETSTQVELQLEPPEGASKEHGTCDAVVTDDGNGARGTGQ